jgi:N-acetylmuramoyl-L-alanine amidase
MTKRTFTLLIGVLLLIAFAPVWASLQSGKGQTISTSDTARSSSQNSKTARGHEAKATVRTHEDCVDAQEACLPPEAPPVLPLTGITILLDAGHGGSDSGAIRDGVYEKDVNLSVTLKLRDLLLKQGATVYLTREDDTFLTLDERKALIAKYAPNLFLSIHSNAHNKTAIDGIEAYYWNDDSPTLAQSIYQAVSDGLGERGNWVRKRELAVVHHEFAPAALIEIGYLSNPRTRKLLADDNYQSRVADSIESGIVEYVSKQRPGGAGGSSGNGNNNPPAKPAADTMSVVGL